MRTDAELQEGGQITGKVTAASTQDGIVALEVCAIAVSNGETRCGSTGAGGDYDVTGLPAGGYRVEFGGEHTHKYNYAPQFYDDHGSSAEAQTVSVVAGAVTSGIDAELQEGGIISGVVKGPGGLNPVSGRVEVCAYTITGEVSECVNPLLGWEYRLEGLESGEYVVGFSSIGFNYLTQYYDDKSSLAEADPVSVIVGQATSEINAKFNFAGRITGRVTNAATNAPIEGIEVCVEPSEWNHCVGTNSNGEYAISELTSGEYQLTFSSQGLDYFFFRQAAPVSVTAGQVTSGVNAALTEGGRMTGRVTNAVTGEPIERVEACAREVGGDEVQCGTTNSNGEYAILELNGGYWVEVRARFSNYLARFYGSGSLEREAQVVSVTEPNTTGGIDIAMQPGVFAGPVNTERPTVSGTDAVGEVLSCLPGSWTGNPGPTFYYHWLRDGTPIAGATASSYVAQSADEGHSLSCEVSAINYAGNTVGTARAVSASVMIAPGLSTGSLPGASIESSPSTALQPSLSDSAPLVTVTVSKLVVAGDSAPVPVECRAATCGGSIELTMRAPAKTGDGKTALSRRATLVLARGSFSLAEGTERTVVLRLTAVGKKMLAPANKHHPVAAKLKLSVNGGLTMTKAILAI